MYCLVPAQYKVIHCGTGRFKMAQAVHELYKVVQGGKRWRKNGSEQYIQVHPGMHCDVLIQYIPVHPGTYCDVLILIAQPGYAFLLDLLLHFYPV